MKTETLLLLKSMSEKLESENKQLKIENDNLRSCLIQLIDNSIDDLLDLKKKIHNELISEKSE